jgi:hypothetical protein
MEFLNKDKLVCFKADKGDITVFSNGENAIDLAKLS